MCGLELDEWQQDDLRDLMGLDEEGRWVHFEFGENVSRQNGKGAILEVRELALLCGITDERLGVQSAHTHWPQLIHRMHVGDSIHAAQLQHVQLAPRHA